MVQTSETGEGIFDKLKGSMDKARMMGSRVVPNFGQHSPPHPQVKSGACICTPHSSRMARHSLGLAIYLCHESLQLVQSLAKLGRLTADTLWTLGMAPLPTAGLLDYYKQPPDSLADVSQLAHFFLVLLIRCSAECNKPLLPYLSFWIQGGVL